MTDLLDGRREALTPTGNRRPVELAVVDGIAANFPPETFLYIVFQRPDGGARVRYAWTDGGTDLGDRIDRQALAAGLDFADNLHITDRHKETSHRGQVRIQAHPLRPILADVQAAIRCPEERRAGLHRFIECAAERTGQTPLPGTPRWMGVGPTLLNRKGA